MIDDGTGFGVARRLPSQTAAYIWSAFVDAWLGWAGPADTVVSDNEYGIIGEAFTAELSKSGSFFSNTAAYAPWQKGKVERQIEGFKAVMNKTILQEGVQGSAEMKLIGIEVATVLNQRPVPTGVSPALMLLCQRLKLDGEISAEKLSLGPGSLVLFRGRNSLHRVTPAKGSKPRMLAVLAYNTESGISLSESARMTFYGRLG